MAEKTLQVLDIDEQEAIGKALILMLQQCPIVMGNEIKIIFEDMDEDAIGIFTQQGTVYLKQFLSGSFRAQYSFFLRYRINRTDDDGRISYENILELIAKWMELRPVTYEKNVYQLTAYPTLTDGRTVESIIRTSNAFVADQADDGTIDYQIYLQLRYMKGE